MRVLLIEDEHKIATAIKTGLEQSGFAVDLAHDAGAGERMALNGPYDVVVLDRMLGPGADGVEVVQAMRREDVQIPVLMLTARGSIGDRVSGLSAGADDYLVKPFAFDELVARIRSLLRRPVTTLAPKLDYKNITLNPSEATVIRAGKPLLLTTKEFALLEYLMRNQGRVVTKDELIEHVWNFDADVLPNTVEVYIGYLRSKLEKRGSPKLIHTVRGFGYRFGDPATNSTQ